MGFHVGIQYTIPSMDGMGKTSILLPAIWECMKHIVSSWINLSGAKNTLDFRFALAINNNFQRTQRPSFF